MHQSTATLTSSDSCIGIGCDAMRSSDSTNYFSETKPNEPPVSKTKRTIKHGARFSRKLQKRLTIRTLAEARALKEQGTECIHVLLYVMELVRRNVQSIYHLPNDSYIQSHIYNFVKRKIRHRNLCRNYGYLPLLGKYKFHLF